ncbi:unnamed protein product [Prorocentrum cordatum]|uniref:Uncharacterized protein n=1 Tax=Prorocentrum cordatum TaxID=2364126 RepID=A0ABN9QMR3_9DINO|nr:unnamed protein product [Polarella glacialis]
MVRVRAGRPGRRPRLGGPGGGPVRAARPLQQRVGLRAVALRAAARGGGAVRDPRRGVECKPCMGAIAAARSGDSSSLRPDKTRPVLPRASPDGAGLVNVAVGAMVVIVLEGSSQRRHALGWINSPERDPLVLMRIVEQFDELEAALHELSGKLGLRLRRGPSPGAHPGPPAAAQLRAPAEQQRQPQPLGPRAASTAASPSSSSGPPVASAAGSRSRNGAPPAASARAVQGQPCSPNPSRSTPGGLRAASAGATRGQPWNRRTMTTGSPPVAPWILQRRRRGAFGEGAGSAASLLAARDTSEYVWRRGVPGASARPARRCPLAPRSSDGARALRHAPSRPPVGGGGAGVRCC